MRCLGSPSSSPHRFEDHSLLWQTFDGDSKGESSMGFPASARVVMLPGLANYSLLELFAGRDSSLIFTPPLCCLIDTMKENGIKTEFYRQITIFSLLLVCWLIFLLEVLVDMTHEVDAFSDDAIAQTPRIIIGSMAGIISFVLALKFMLNEFNELFENTLEDEVDLKKERLDVIRIQERAKTQINLLESGPTGAFEQAPTPRLSSGSRKTGKGGGSRSAVQRLVLETSVMRQSARNTSPQKMALDDTDLQAATVHRLNRHSPAAVHPQPPHDGHGHTGGNGSMHDVHAMNQATFWRSRLRAEQNAMLQMDANVVRKSFKSARADVRDLPAVSSAGQEEGRQQNAGGEEALAHGLAGKGIERPQSALAKLVKVMKKGLRSLHVDVAYFASAWNWLGLSSFCLIIATCSLYLRAFRTCRELMDQCTLPRNENLDLTVTWLDPMTADCKQRQEYCIHEINVMRGVSSIGTLSICFYTLYYLRGFNEYAFLVRMVTEILKDMMTFFVLSAWFLFAISVSFMSLNCGMYADNEAAGRADNFFKHLGAKLEEFLQTVATLTVVVFDPNRYGDESMQECLHSETLTTTVATIIFYLQVIMCPLVLLNALIAIMSSTYNRVAAQHDQQQYKEWATIICDIVRKWSNTRRLKFERDFYWLHVLRRKSDSAGSLSMGERASGSMAAAGRHQLDEKKDMQVDVHKRLNDIELHLLGLAEMLEKGV